MGITTFLVRKDLGRGRVFSAALVLLACLLVSVLGTAVGGVLSNGAAYDDDAARWGAPDLVMVFGGGRFSADDEAELLARPMFDEVSVARGISGRVTSGSGAAPLTLLPAVATPGVAPMSGPPSDGTGIAVPRTIAATLKVGVGDRVEVKVGADALPLTVTELVDDAVFGSPVMSLSRAFVAPSTLAGLDARTATGAVPRTTIVSAWTSEDASTVIDEYPGTSRADLAYTASFVRRAYTMIPGVISALLLLVTVTLAVVLTLALRQIALVLIHRDWRIAGILKAIGLSAGRLRRILVLRLALLGAGGATAGGLVAVLAIPRLATAFLGSNGLPAPRTVVLWPVLVVVLACLALIVVVTRIASRPLREVTPRDAVLAGDPRPAGGRPVRMSRRLAMRWPAVAFAVHEVRRQPGRYATLAVSTGLFTFLSLCLVALSASFGSPVQVSQALGLNTFDIALTRAVGQAGDSDEWLREISSTVDLPGGIQFASAMQQVNVRTDVGTISATVSDRFPRDQSFGPGRAPDGVGEVALASALAADLTAEVGDTIEVPTAAGELVELRVTGIYQTVNQTGLTLWLSSATYRDLDPAFDPRIFVLAAGDVATIADIDAAVAALNARDDVIATAGRSAVDSLITTLRTTVLTLATVFAATTIMIAAMVSLLLCFTMLAAESRALAVREAIGAGRAWLRRQLAGRLALVALIGSLVGALLAIVLSRSALGSLLGAAGLSTIDVALPWWAGIGAPLLIALISSVSALTATRRLPRPTPALLAGDF